MRGSHRRAGLVMRLLAVTLGLRLAGFPPVTLLAQDQSACALFGACVPPSGGTIPGLPQGLPVRSAGPWDRVVKGTAATAWEPIEVEARAFLAALHGVPNDDRLPHDAVDEIRAWMLGRLLDLAERQENGETLTATETAAVEALRDAIVARRTAAAQDAVNEYSKWAVNPCGYTVPQNPDPTSTPFNFDPYNPGPSCGISNTVGSGIGNVGVLAGAPQPPTKDQFTAYGAALANIDFTPADAAAATARLNENLAYAASIGGAVAAAGVTAVLAVTVPAVATTFATLIGSSVAAGATTILSGASLGATAAFNGAAALGGAGAITGIGAAAGASIVGFALLALAVTIVGSIEIAEDAQIYPALQQDVLDASNRPLITGMLQDSTQSVTLMMAFMAQTLPDYETQRTTAGPVPPDAPLPGSPVFAVNGVQQSVLATVDPDGTLRETFMSGGWFVTRTRKTAADVFGLWRWALKIPYVNADGTHAAVGIQPAGFLDVDDSGTVPPKAAVKTTSFTLGNTMPVSTVTFAGNHSPLLNATASALPVINAPVTFTAGASDPDGDALVVGWYFQDFTFAPSNPDFTACDLRPTPTDPTAVQCPWVAVSDSGSGVTRTFSQAGTYGVLVVARDSHGALSSQRFYVNISGPPSLSLTPPAATTVSEGDSVTISGTLDYPRLANGDYPTLTSLVIAWGDGTTTTHDYPCSPGLLTGEPAPPGATLCTLEITLTGGLSATGQQLASSGDSTVGFSGGPAGPWSFQFSHAYAFSPTNAVPGQPTIKVYATTLDNLATPITTYNMTVNNIAPSLQPDSVCPLASVPFCAPSLVSGPDIREVAAGSPLTLGATIADAQGASHAVKVFWGDGDSSFLPAGCTDAGCPTPAALQLVPNRQVTVLSLTHTYGAPGTYPIQLIADDGGPGGLVTASATATVYGVKIDGPTNVTAGLPVTYTLTSTVPGGFSVDSMTPSCTGGTITASTPTSFTCTFADVPTATVGAANVTSSIVGQNIPTSLGVNVFPRAPVLSGPTTVTGGKSATYTYQPSEFPSLIEIPGCTGQVTAFTPGSITCSFADGQAPYTGGVTVTQIDTLVTVGFSHPLTVTTFAVNVVPDLDPPVLTVPSPGPIVPSTSNAGAIVSYQVSALDAVSGPATPQCSPASGTLFPIGSTPVSCSASDWKGNTATRSFTVLVTDATPPTLSLPAAITVDATTPTGAIVTFAAMAADVAPLAPAVTCLPASGARFPIGTTIVTCHAADAAGNQASGQFTVTVFGAVAELESLETYVANLPIDNVTKDALLVALRIADASVAAHRRTACAELDVVAALVNAASKIKQTKLTTAQAAQIVSTIVRIKTVNGC